jgi:hypothetical protein
MIDKLARRARNSLRGLLWYSCKGYLRRRIRRAFPPTDFVGPYEQEGVYDGICVEQWLWAHRHLVRGVVLEMSTPRHYHEFIYQLPAVEKVLIGDLYPGEVRKGDHASPVDVAGDFCAAVPPAPPVSFDTVLCLSILEHCADPQAMVRNVGTVLRPGGHAFFYCPFAYIDGHMGDLCPDYWRFGRDGYRLLADKAGLDIVDMGEYDDLGPFFLFKYGFNAGATSWHRGVPVVNWMICRRPER